MASKDAAAERPAWQGDQPPSGQKSVAGTGREAEKNGVQTAKKDAAPLPEAAANRVAERAKALEDRARRLEQSSGKMRETILLRLQRMEEALERLEEGAAAAE